MSNRRLIVKVQRRGGVDNDDALVRHVRRIASLMFSARMANTLRITVKVRAGLAKGTLGSCDWRDMSKGKTARSKHYTIRVQRDMPLAQQLSTITHEMKHVEQMATGRLTVRVTYGTAGIFWREVGQTGQATKFSLVDGKPEISWCCRPWEKEAVKAEEQYAFLLPQG